MKEINIRDIGKSPVELIADGWGLVTAGNSEKFNTMTVSWGAVGEIWGKDAAFIFIRPQRYTYEFTEKSDYFTLTFFAPGEQREALALCGTKSGREMDKFAAAGLSVAFAGCGAPYVAEGELVLVCRKLYAQYLKEDCFVEKNIIDKNYPTRDFHRMYVGEIVEAWRRK